MKHACQAGCGRTFASMEDAEVHEGSCQGEARVGYMPADAAYGALIASFRGLAGFDRYCALMGAVRVLEVARDNGLAPHEATVAHSCLVDLLEQLTDERERLFRVLSGRP